VKNEWEGKIISQHTKTGVKFAVLPSPNNNRGTITLTRPKNKNELG